MNNKKEALLLKERWSLLQSGVNKADVKIGSGAIYIKGKKVGYVSNLVFHSVNASHRLCLWTEILQTIPID